MQRIILILILFFPLIASAQKKIDFIHADVTKGRVVNGVRVERAIGNVQFKQNTTLIYCDSAYFYRSANELEAFGHVHIIDDSVDITSLRLKYDGTKKIAHLRQNVVFEKTKIAKLYTDNLDYYRVENEARYFKGGKLVDTANVLTSQKGYYDVNTNLASFKKDVVGTNPDYTMTSDTLQYNSKTRIVYFRDYTQLKDKDGKTAVYESGVYDTKQKMSNLSTGVMETPSYKIKADNYSLDDKKKYYRVKGHVAMTSKNENMTVFGDDGLYDKKNGISKVWNNAYAAKVSEEGDTLFLSADTLVSLENIDPKKKRLLAYHSVKIYKKDMQGKADSLAYVSADSVLYFYRDPVLWNDENQMTADSIRMLLKNKKIDRIYMVNNSFVVSIDSLHNFNQIKGRKMTTYFENKSIHHVVVEGNGESIYHALEEKEVVKDSVLYKITFLVGMNKIICSNIRINFKDGKVNSINFLVKPDANFYPPHKILEADRKLKGFTWRADQRPRREDVVKIPNSKKDMQDKKDQEKQNKKDQPKKDQQKRIEKPMVNE